VSERLGGEPRTGAIQVNHMLVVNDALARERPEAAGATALTERNRRWDTTSTSKS
jgi:hypothetical protein